MRRADVGLLVRYVVRWAFIAIAPPAVQAQSSIVIRADSAFAAEDRALARRLYEEAVRANPEHARAVFRLGQLEPSPDKALAFYARYVALEPRDPWGHMALGDQLARMDRVGEALESYAKAQALAPNERDVAIGRARIESRAGRSRAARQTLANWTAANSEDGEAWDLLGREQLRAGRPRTAAHSFTNAQRAGFTRGVENRLRVAHSQSGAAFEPIVGYQRDSDGNSTLRTGLSADVMVVDGTRLGGGLRRGSVRDAVASLQVTDLSLRLASRPTARLRIAAEGGIARFDDISSDSVIPATGPPAPPGGPPSAPPGQRPPVAPLAAASSWTEPRADVRLRWRGMPNAPALELGAQHLPLGTAPRLVANHVTRTEARAMLELPAGPLRLRSSGRAGVVSASSEAANRRLDGAAALALPLGTSAELSARYHAVTYARESFAGYFAPRVAETMEGTTYLDLGADGPLSFSADLGAGVQRTALQGEDVGRWKAAFRAWTYLSLVLGPARALWLEVEAYDAPFAPLGVAAAPSWRYVALTTGLRWAIR